MNQHNYQSALECLKQVLLKLDSIQDLKYIEAHRDEVLQRYGNIFSPNHIPTLTEQEFRSFLVFENNHHWTGIHRHGATMCADMDNLRSALGVLLENSRPLEPRYDRAINQVSGLGKATATPILLVAYPDNYGVWNTISEEGMKRLDLWPDFDRGTTGGEKYAQINKILNQLAQDLDIDLWTLDSLWWGLDEVEPIAGEEELVEEKTQRFALERHLHDFLRDNWSKTSLGNEWVLYSEPGDEDLGYEYPTGVGRIDLLATHRKEAEWLVIELKRGQTSDETVGQVLRYIGWVKNHLAEPGEIVRGLVIAREPSESLLYALDALSAMDIGVQRYEVEFNLFPVSLELD